MNPTVYVAGRQKNYLKVLGRDAFPYIICTIQRRPGEPEVVTGKSGGSTQRRKCVILKGMADNPQDDPRVYLAAERTLLAWLRTGLGLMGVGFAVARFGLFLREFQVSQPQAPMHTTVSVVRAMARPAIGGGSITSALNFGAGPAMLPTEVMLELREELLDYRGTRQSVMEMGHRTPMFEPIAADTEATLRSLMGISEDYAVLFLQGGAATQFGMVPVNLAPAPGSKADYAVTGHWSNRAWQEGQKLADAGLAMDAKASNYMDIPPVSSWKIRKDAAYLHYTVNETIGGVEFPTIPEVGVPLAADMTSMILSRPVDVKRYALIYAAAQKNLGIAGLTVVIVRRDALKAPAAGIPTMLDYRAHIEQHSMLNTPSVYPWYVCGKMLHDPQSVLWNQHEDGDDFSCTILASPRSILIA